MKNSMISVENSVKISGKVSTENAVKIFPKIQTTLKIYLNISLNLSHISHFSEKVELFYELKSPVLVGQSLIL